jgi:hypothetical protein
VDRNPLFVCALARAGIVGCWVGYGDPVPVRKTKLWLQDADQELLGAALSGLTDEDLSTRLHLSVGAVKKRWLALLDGIADRQPNLLCSSDTKTGRKRGRQKRNHVLEYVRQHPEELRPNVAKPERLRSPQTKELDISAMRVAKGAFQQVEQPLGLRRSRA